MSEEHMLEVTQLPILEHSKVLILDAPNEPIKVIRKKDKSTEARVGRVIYDYTSDGYSKFNLAVRRNLVPASTNQRARGFLTTSLRHDVMPAWPHFSGEEAYAHEQDYIRKSKLLNMAINLRPLPFPVTSYRGIQDIPFVTETGQRFMSGLMNEQLQVGNVLPLSGFVSTTLSPSYAVCIATARHVNDARDIFRMYRNEITSDGILLQFELPVGFPALYIDIGEYELILPYEILPDFNKKGKVPYWIVARRDRIRVRVRPWDTEMTFITSFSDYEDAKYITITRVVLRPYERSLVSFS